jgi:hypothetical protein
MLAGRKFLPVSSVRQETFLHSSPRDLAALSLDRSSAVADSGHDFTGELIFVLPEDEGPLIPDDGRAIDGIAGSVEVHREAFSEHLESGHSNTNQDNRRGSSCTCSLFHVAAADGRADQRNHNQKW